MKKPYWMNRVFLARVLQYGLRYWYSQAYRHKIKVILKSRRRKDKYGSGELSKTHFLKKRILGKRERGFCVLCRLSFPRKELTLDHIVPRSRGGKTTKENLQVLCKKCHSIKDNQKKRTPPRHPTEKEIE